MATRPKLLHGRLAARCSADLRRVLPYLLALPRIFHLHQSSVPTSTRIQQQNRRPESRQARQKMIYCSCRLTVRCSAGGTASSIWLQVRQYQCRFAGISTHSQKIHISVGQSCYVFGSADIHPAEAVVQSAVDMSHTPIRCPLTVPLVCVTSSVPASKAHQWASATDLSGDRPKPQHAWQQIRHPHGLPLSFWSCRSFSRQ